MPAAPRGSTISAATRRSTNRTVLVDQPLYAAQAELLRRAGDREAAGRAYERALALSGNAVERAELERRLAGLRR
jgi:predicted RNA polymerase sigma factor